MPWFTVRLLRVLTPLTAVMSLVAQGIMLCSNAWIHTEELIQNPLYNGTGDTEFLSKYTISGLWRLCYNDPGKNNMRCFDIDYFPKEDYSPDPNDSTMAIPYAMKRAATFLFMSSIALLIGEMLCFCGHMIRRRRILTFAAGVAFILSGLLVLMGVVIYISSFKAEVGNKLQPKSSFQGPIFKYRYGYTFAFTIASILICELSGTFSLYLYIQWYKLDSKKYVERLKYEEFLQSGEDHIPCRRHPRGPRNSRTRDTSREASPCPSTSRGRRNTNPGIPLSESMKDLAYYNFPPFSRDTTCYTVSTTADINREYSREFSFETLRRTTPV
ncbi:voltage-dependent calcium channel gamma-5 subunit-like isoform X2 [Limulus polyphemus]|uniref:Voltage-dependent calcium channel gamma-5 subunit-like isoform X1 n=1 Tax=Limulus polyphemus TaxID=6850 RepID=A0ABM1T0E2_LIMPO|nr:voltage-dependent calcium channel gamma-5 subunit-like isoform X1 [Limulus polyphemus]XP_022249348.1 voltage-dependent calcium channel gamma-5 subunit-like isoform X2 [Limulus polyphemus]